MLLKLLIPFTVTLFPAVCYACEPTVLSGLGFDPKAKVAADCSFTDAGTPRTEMFGGAVVDLKNGRIGQRLSVISNECSLPVHESLMVADCKSLDTIIISGQPSDELRARNANATDQWYGVENKTRNLYPPHGAVRLTSDATVAVLEQVAEANGYSHQRNARTWGAYGKKKNQFNLFCGCKNYYPNSRGAALE